LNYGIENGINKFKEYIDEAVKEKLKL